MVRVGGNFLRNSAFYFVLLIFNWLHFKVVKKMNYLLELYETVL